MQPQFRSSLLAVKQRLLDGRQRLGAQHRQGVLGARICAQFAELHDRAVVDLLEASLADSGLESLRQEIALVPHGGYGRREVAPYSDLDLMLLHTGQSPQAVQQLAGRLWQDLFDVGLRPGHSVRTPAEALLLARSDVITCTSLLEGRFLAGNERIFQKFDQRYRKFTHRRSRRLYEAVVVARRQERAKFGETVYLLKPNVKRSRGGLRELQLLRWIAAIRLGTPNLDRLHGAEQLSAHDQRRLNSASEFLLRLRNELHFHAGQAQDVLSKPEQVRIAELLGYQGTSVLLPVEQFMRDYFRHTSTVRFLVSRFVKGLEPAPLVAQLLTPLLSQNIDGDYRLGRNEISATSRGYVKLRSDLEEVLRLLELANRYDKRIAHKTWEAVCRAAPSYTNDVTPAVAERFVSLLGSPANLGNSLRKLHELGVLEKIIPEFRHARCLLQFNEYHKYTVDEHSFRAVEHAATLAEGSGLLGELYRGLRNKQILHLALLLHDLGKGYPEDHSEVGRRIAAETCQRLRLSPHDTQLVIFLVHKHLLMSHLALRRDTNDDQLVLRFAVEVGSAEALQMLLILSCADLAAVGPGVLNSWKIEVLTQLYSRAIGHLAGDESEDFARRLDHQREQIRVALAGDEAPEWFEPHLVKLPGSLLRQETPERAANTLRALRTLGFEEAQAWGDYLPETAAVRYTVVVDHGHGRGVFYKLTGALASQGLEILAAEINSLGEQYVLDRFEVRDPLYREASPPAQRLQQIGQTLVESLHENRPPRFRRIWKGERTVQSQLSQLPTEVRIDNSTSQRCTILDIFTFDRPGLLYTIARTLFELKLSIAAARIGTYLDQVVDVFYVTDWEHQKIEDEGRLTEIRTRLLTAIRS